MPIDRRRFITTALCAAGAGVAGAYALRYYNERRAVTAAAIAAKSEGYGPLIPAVTSDTSERILALPQGFSYKVLSRAGAKMSDGRPTPARADGMSSFAVGDEIRLVRNHEILNTPSDPLWDEHLAYDRLAGGGTTTLVIDPATRTLEREFQSLSGTLFNCAGGPTPWGSWISCEETVVESGGWTQRHGYVFEVPAASDELAKREPLRALGRFTHEALAVDPATGIVYETEDYYEAGFYRFTPEKRGDLAAGGRLQMLAINGRRQYDTRRGQRVGDVLPCSWVDLPDVDPSSAATNPSALFQSGFDAGGARFARLEGCWAGNGAIYINSTCGGDAELGQVWKHTPSTGTLELIFESPSAAVLNSPDNITVSPRGGLVICEDCMGEQFIRGLTPDGRIFDFARNELYDSEFAGVCFSPDGQTLFVNLQIPGLTLAIWGPWREGLV